MSLPIRQLVDHYTNLWTQCDTSYPLLSQSYSEADQKHKENQLDQFLHDVKQETATKPHKKTEKLRIQERIFLSFSRFAKTALGFDDKQLDILHDFIYIASDFAEKARKFDPKISGEDIYQATRNVWTMNGLQRLFGQAVELTPAIFGYSMLYPYTDNYLDSATVPLNDKKRFNQRLNRRLEGETLTPRSTLERQVYQLVAQIEKQWHRSRHSEVYESLLAIQHAQNQSLDLIHHSAQDDDDGLMQITFEKGGTSVIADAYLVADSATVPQQNFIFGYGAFLQLVDDLQDIHDDLDQHRLTVFTDAYQNKTLELKTNTTFHFGENILACINCFNASNIEPLKELMAHSAVSLLINAIGRANSYFPESYCSRIEKHSSFRFSYMGNGMTGKIKKHLVFLDYLNE